MKMLETRKKVKVERAKGIGGVLQKQLAPLETNEKFRKFYRDFKATYLLNATDSKYAAMVEFNHTNISVESISNVEKKSLTKEVLKWDAMLATSTPLFLKIAMGELGLGAMVGKIVRRKMKVKGLKNLIMLKKIFGLLH